MSDTDRDLLHCHVGRYAGTLADEWLATHDQHDERPDRELDITKDSAR